MDIDRICIDFKAELMGIYGKEQNGEEYIPDGVRENYMELLDLILKDNEYTEESEIERICIDFQEDFVQVNDDIYYFMDLKKYMDKIFELFNFEIIDTSEIQGEFEKILLRNALQNSPEMRNDVQKTLVDYKNKFNQFMEDNQMLLEKFQMQILILSVVPELEITDKISSLYDNLVNIREMIDNELSNDFKVFEECFNRKENDDLVEVTYNIKFGVEKLMEVNNLIIDNIEKNAAIIEDVLPVLPQIDEVDLK